MDNSDNSGIRCHHYYSMLSSTRNSIGNFMETASGPFIVHFRFWYESKYKEQCLTQLQLGKRLNNINQTYTTGQKYILFDIAGRNTMPVCKIESGASSAEIDLKKYQPGLHKQHSVNVGKIKFVFTFQLLSTTADISTIYASEKISDEQKFRYEESVNDLIRSEAEFLSKYQKDFQLEPVNQKQKEEAETEAKLTAQLSSIKSIDFNIKTLFTLFVLFFLIGYFITGSEPPKKKARKKPKKAKL